MEDSRVPDGFGPPFATITDDDHTAWIVITALLGLVYSLLFGLVRALVSWSTGRGRPRADDIALAISTVCLKSTYHVNCSLMPFSHTLTNMKRDRSLPYCNVQSFLELALQDLERNGKRFHESQA